MFVSSATTFQSSTNHNHKMDNNVDDVIGKVEQTKQITGQEQATTPALISSSPGKTVKEENNLIQIPSRTDQPENSQTHILKSDLSSNSKVLGCSETVHGKPTLTTADHSGGVNKDSCGDEASIATLVQEATFNKDNFLLDLSFLEESYINEAMNLVSELGYAIDLSDLRSISEDSLTLTRRRLAGSSSCSTLSDMER